MSYWEGKAEVCSWIRDHFLTDARILDVGAYDGNWHKLLPEYTNMDAVEVYKPNYDKLKEMNAYKWVWCQDARDFRYMHYDLIIFGDIIEHMSPEDAKKMLDYAYPKCRDMIISVPFLYKQDAIYGNPYEVHVQDDLTPELFEERYPGYSVLCRAREDYCYYHKGDR